MNTPNIKNYKPKDFAVLVGVSVKNLQRWDREGTLKANKSSCVESKDVSPANMKI